MRNVLKWIVKGILLILFWPFISMKYYTSGELTLTHIDKASLLAIGFLLNLLYFFNYRNVHPWNMVIAA
jgi:hypothetical protein